MVRTVEPLLGTRVEVGVDGCSDTGRRQVEDEVVAEVARLERIFTVFDPDSELHRFVQTGTTDAPELWTVLDLASSWRGRTDGLFDPAIGTLMARWDQAEREGTEPTPHELAGLVGEPAPVGPSVDNLNAIAKGWIADRAVTIASNAHVADGIWINAGGDVVHRGSGSITVGVEDPRRPYDNAAPLAAVRLSGEALATSGGARRFWTIGAKRYAKVLDPRSGRPVDRVDSATVVARDAATADVLATVALIARTDETLALVADVGADCLLVLADGEVVASSARFGRG